MAWCCQATSHCLSQVEPELCCHMLSLSKKEATICMLFKMLWRKKNLFLSFLNMLVVEIFPYGKQGTTYPPQLISWQLITWWRQGPGNQQPWYQPSSPKIFQPHHQRDLLNGHSTQMVTLKNSFLDHLQFMFYSMLIKYDTFHKISPFPSTLPFSSWLPIRKYPILKMEYWHVNGECFPESIVITDMIHICCHIYHTDWD